MGHAIARAPEPVPPKRAAHYLWAVLIARIYEVFPLLCLLRGGQMRIIAFITHSADIRHILWAAVGGCARARLCSPLAWGILAS
jgi:hypothetical protein